MGQKYENGIVFFRRGNLVVSRQGKRFEVVTTTGSDGGPELVKDFTTAEEAIKYAESV